MEVVVGAQCAVQECRQLDFLPFTCDLCSLTYCLDHRTYQKHRCPRADEQDCRVILCPICHNSIRIVPNEDINLTFERHRTSPDCKKKEKKARCPVAECKEKLTFSNTFDCKKCGKQVCLKHRFEDLHPCIEEKPRPKQKPASAPATKPSSVGGQQKQQSYPNGKPSQGKRKQKGKGFGGLFACMCGKKQMMRSDDDDLLS